MTIPRLPVCHRTHAVTSLVQHAYTACTEVHFHYRFVDLLSGTDARLTTLGAKLSFELMTADKAYVLRAKDGKDLADWLKALRGIISLGMPTSAEEVIHRVTRTSSLSVSKSIPHRPNSGSKGEKGELGLGAIVEDKSSKWLSSKGGARSSRCSPGGIVCGSMQ